MEVPFHGALGEIDYIMFYDDCYAQFAYVGIIPGFAGPQDIERLSVVAPLLHKTPFSDIEFHANKMSHF